ncbi:polysaccharide deacetylase family protein [Cohnella mopanensis]|uniref:polysaccharide deacetylase family protein n=1 Tax=Cohnella mopanensis TaxID=2911966 RepID=UPI001EF7C2D7|nr:polysaccharide deacetylase family protein [Cohnella mopanensis]
MRRQHAIKRRALLGMLLIILTVGLCGCSSLQQWESSELMGHGVANAATPTETASPEATAPSTESLTPTETVKQPPKTEIPPEVNKTEIYKNRKLVALTFDDGPDGKYTTQILDILHERNVKATFFLVGQQVNKYPEVAKRIVEDGHSVGNHSWSHLDLTKQSSKSRDQEIDKTQKAILDATGVTPVLMRAPYGAISKSVLDSVRGRDMKHVYWTVDTKDWAGTSVQTMYKNVMANTNKGGVVLMHSFGGRKHAIEHTIKLLPLIIDDLQAKGYEFVTVDELIASGQSRASVIK